MIKLNTQQKNAAEFMTGIASVVAVPGSGKTWTMTMRIGNLVKRGVAPENILGLTFTRNAAQAMREKLKPILDDVASRVTLSTIHAFCHGLLRNEGRVFDILTGKDQLVFIRKIMQTLKVKGFPVGMVLREIGLSKNNLVSASEFRALYEGDMTMTTLADVYEAYEDEKRKKMLFDLDDLLLETYTLLTEKEDVREKYRETFRHILVDEFQDTNPAQMEILKLLVGPQDDGSSFWVCGDDWQAIYAFTGASVGNILNFERVFDAASRFILDMNYRSTPEILSACQNLISHNLKKIEKTLHTENPEGDAVVVLEAATEEDEARRVADEISDLVARRGYQHKNLAVLYRANYQSRAFEETFSQLGIPYHIENGTSFYQRFEVKVLLDYLRLILDPDSDAGDEAFRSVANVPNRYMGRKFLGELEDYANEHGVHLYEGLKSMPIVPFYLAKASRNLTRLVDLFIEHGKAMPPAELIQTLREALDYDKAVVEDDVPSPDDSRIANVNQLQLVATRFKDARSLLEYADTFRDDQSTDPEGVSLMTIHKSKGLEFPVVFLVGMVDGVLPNKNGDIEEERRVAFVGLSRAMSRLYLTHSHNFLGKPAKRSPFLDEVSKPLH